MTKTFVWQFIFKTAVFRNISDVTVENIWHHFEDIGLAFFTQQWVTSSTQTYGSLSRTWHSPLEGQNFSSSRENPLFKACWLSHARYFGWVGQKVLHFVRLDHILTWTLHPLSNWKELKKILVPSFLWFYISAQPIRLLTAINKPGWLFCSGSHSVTQS